MLFESDLVLRQRLHDAIRDVEQPILFVERIEALRRAVAHRVFRLDETHPDYPTAPLDVFTCFAFALNLADSPLYRKVIETFHWIHQAGSEFVVELLGDGTLREVEATFPGAIALYFDGEVPAHAAKVYGDELISKWGSGLLWRHPLDEVPISYGHEVRFYQPLTTAEAETAFVKYVGPLVVERSLAG